MMIAVAVGAESSQPIARRTVVVMRIIVATAKRLAWLIARRKMSVYNGRRVFGRSRVWNTAMIAPAMDVSGWRFLARELVSHVGESHDGASTLAMRTQSIRLSRASAETDEQSGRHGPVSLPVVGASAYHYWEREAIDRARRARDRPAKRRRSQ
jgi:hypothetical protein